MTRCSQFAARLPVQFRLSRRGWLALCALSWAGSLSSCQHSTPNDSLEQEVVAYFIDSATLQHRKLENKTRKLELAAAELCDQPSEESLEAARDAYLAARRPWIRSRAFSFGPEVNFPQRYKAKIDFQPPRHDDMAELLSSDDPLPPADETGSHLRGFPAVEYLLFGPISNDLEADSRGCDYLSSVSADLHENAQALFFSWDPGHGNYAAEARAETGNTFESTHEALSGIVNRMSYVVENIRDQDLRAPLGDLPGDIMGDLIVDRLSGRSLKNIEDALDSVESFFFGDAATPRPGLSQFAHAQGYDFDAPISEALAAARAALSEMGPTLIDAFHEQEDQLEQLDESLYELQLLLQIDIIAALELSQIFNEADGD